VVNTVPAVLAEAAGTAAVSPAVVELARGVNRMTNLRMLVVLGTALGVLGSAGAGIYFATAADPIRPVALSGVVPNPGAPPAAGAPREPAPQEVKTEPKRDGSAALLKPFGREVGESVKLAELLSLIEDQTDLVLRVDVAAFQRVGAIDGNTGVPAQQFLGQIYDSTVMLPRKVAKLPSRDVLADALAQVRLSHPCTYQVRGSQLVIVPAYLVPGRPGANPLAPAADDDSVIPATTLYEQIHGGVVSVSAERKPLIEILADLRAQTGANIVLDPRCEAQEKKMLLSITLSDVRLYDALRVIADMAELKMVYTGNIYYVTTPANAKLFQPPPVLVPRSPAPKGPLLGAR
jgi:hypothetical protein